MKTSLKNKIEPNMSRTVDRYNPYTIAATGGTLAVLQQSAQLALNNREAIRSAAGQAREAFNQVYPNTPPDSALRAREARAGTGNAARELNFEDQPGESMDIDDKPATSGTSNLTSDTSNNGGGAYGLKGSSSGGLEYIPGHIEDDMKKTMTLKTSNTFRAYYSQQGVAAPVFKAIKTGTDSFDSTGTGVQLGINGVSAKIMEVTTPWRYIPNNRLDLYCTPAQMSRFVNAGYTGYRVKRCGFKLYGVYNMQNYSFSANDLQGADTAFFAVMEPKNKFYKNQTPVNHIYDSFLNPNETQPGFVYGDTAELEHWRTTSTTLTNNLVSCKLNIPTSISSTSLINDDNVSMRLYCDTTRHEAQVLVRNGQSYEWSWDNPDSRYINIYNHNFSAFQNDRNTDSETYGAFDQLPYFAAPAANRDPNYRNHRLRRNWPMQILDDAYKKQHDGYWADNSSALQNLNTVGSWKNQALHYTGPSHYGMIPPVLMKIPNLTQIDKEKMNHNVWMYIDYNIEIEFVRGNHTQIFNAPNMVVNDGKNIGPTRFYGGVADFSQVNGFTQQAEMTGEGYGVTYVADLQDTLQPQNYVGDQIVRTSLVKAIPPEQQVSNAYSVAWDYTGHLNPPPPLATVEEEFVTKTAKKAKKEDK